MRKKTKKKSTNFLNKLLTISFGIVVGGAPFFGLYLYTSQMEKDKRVEIKNNLGKTYGKVIKTGNMKGHYLVLEYQVGSNTFTTRGSCPSFSYEKEEYYLIEYSTNNPFNAIVDLTKMKFDKDVITNKTVARVLDLDKRETVYGPYYTIKYSYVINGKNYKQHEKISFENLNNIKIGDLFDVRYNIDYPRSAAPVFSLEKN